MKSIAIYSRVSSKSQDAAGQDAELTAWSKAQTAPVIWYRDKFTGKSMDRPGFNKMLEAIAAGKVDTVAIWRLDRLGRTAKGLTSLFEDFGRQKVNLVSLKDGLDLRTPAGRLMANVLASVAAFETEVRQERQSAGIAAAKAIGKVWGGSQKGRRLTVSVEQVEQIKRLKAELMPIASIARAVNLSRPTVYAILKK